MANSCGATLYFHGLPGSAAELDSFGPAVAAKAHHFHVIERSDTLAIGPVEGYFGRLATQIEAEYPSGALHLVGFSLGAAAAIRVAPLLGARVRQIDLVAPAAPLSLGDFLSGMAGAPIFKAAMAGDFPFGVLTIAQAMAARFIPRRMAGTLMARASGEDAALAKDNDFVVGLTRSLQRSLLAQRKAYKQEISLYVDDWASELKSVNQSVTIWQGGRDGWTPPAMAQALACALSNCQGVRTRPDLSHFSTLCWYLQQADPVA